MMLISREKSVESAYLTHSHTIGVFEKNVFHRKFNFKLLCCFVFFGGNWKKAENFMTNFFWKLRATSHCALLVVDSRANVINHWVKLALFNLHTEGFPLQLQRCFMAYLKNPIFLIKGPKRYSDTFYESDNDHAECDLHPDFNWVVN